VVLVAGGVSVGVTGPQGLKGDTGERGATGSTGACSLDFWFVKTNANGNMQWDKTYGGTVSNTGVALVQNNDIGMQLLVVQLYLAPAEMTFG
jgi:hypothetical protein